MFRLNAEEEIDNLCEFTCSNAAVSRLFIGNNEHYLKFEFTDGTQLIFEAVGDCCSESYFAEFIATRSLIGYKINDIKSIPMMCEEGTRQDSDKIYSYEFLTDAGVSTLVFRNSSNGYYGGWIQVVEPEEVETIWRPILDDNWCSYE